MGWGWMAMFVVGSLVIALATGLIVEALERAGEVKPNRYRIDLLHDFDVWRDANGLKSGRPATGMTIQPARSRCFNKERAMGKIANEERLTRIPTDVAAIIGDAERGDPEIVRANIGELTALFAQLAASYAAVVTTIGMHREPGLTMARNRAVEELDKEIARQMDLWSRMSPPGRS
jgi:hypothetical protein